MLWGNFIVNELNCRMWKK